MIKVICDQCNGYGFVPLEEDGGVVQHACYHCFAVGHFEMSEQQYCDFVNELADEAVEYDNAYA